MIRNRFAGLVLLACVCLMLVPSVCAQAYPAAEAYLGFTAFNNEYGTQRHNSPGVVFNFGYNVHRNLRIVADFGAETHSTDIAWTNGRSAHANDYQFLVGPELTIRSNPSVTPFVHGLVGFAARSYAVPSGNWTCTDVTCYEDTFSIAKEFGFASGVGGGMDWNVRRLISVRVVQFDWIRTNLSRDNWKYSQIQGQLPTLSGWQNNYRFSCGITFRIGEKGSQ